MEYSSKTKKRSTYLIFMLVLNKIIDQAMAKYVLWYGHVLRREDGHVLKRASDLGQRKKGRPKWTWKKV